MKRQVNCSQTFFSVSLIAISINSTFLSSIVSENPYFKQNFSHISVSDDTQLLLAFSGFTDISGIRGSTQIQQLARLGVIETNSNTFRPSQSITRGQFVAWLIKAYNQLHRTPILLTSTAVSAFPDVSPSHPYFRYIQSAHEAGFLVGFEDGTFRPDIPLTREQMIALKSPLDSKGSSRRDADSLRQFVTKTMGFADAEEMGDQYLQYIAFDLGNAAGGKNFQRVYGNTRIYAPKRPVTREEAAILVSEFRKGKNITEVLEGR